METNGDFKNSEIYTENSSKGVENGNTIHSPRVNQLTKWCFTWNNYNDGDIELLLNKLPYICKKYIFQPEKGVSGTKHLQGSIWLKKKMRFSEFNLPKQIHWSKMRNEEACITYCSKDATKDGLTYSFGIPKPIQIITTLYTWQKEIENIYFTEPDNRTVYWYYDRIGNAGKSAFCKYMSVKHKVPVVQGGKLNDLINIIFNLEMTEVTMIIFDIPRNNGNKISYSAVECIKNGMITNTKFETGIKVFNNVHVIIFSNDKPDETQLSSDRWIIKKIKK